MFQKLAVMSLVVGLRAVAGSATDVMQTLALPDDTDMAMASAMSGSLSTGMPAPVEAPTAVELVKVEDGDAEMDQGDSAPEPSSCVATVALAPGAPEGSSATSAVALAEASLQEEMKDDSSEALRRAQLSMRAAEKLKAEKAKEEKKKEKEAEEPETSEKPKKKKGPKGTPKPKGRPRKTGDTDNPKRRRSKKKQNKDDEIEEKSEDAKQEDATTKKPARKRRSKGKARQDGDVEEENQPDQVEAAPKAKAKRSRLSARTEKLDEKKVQKFLDLCRQYDTKSYDRKSDTLHKKPMPQKLTLVPYFSRPACGVKIKMDDGSYTQRIYMSGKYDTVAVNIQQCIYLAEALAEQDPDTFVDWCESEQCLQLSTELEKCAVAAKQRFFDEKQAALKSSHA